jgi:hypothetical protein
MRTLPSPHVALVLCIILSQTLFSPFLVSACDLTCNNRTVVGQFVKCPMCVCRRVCGIHESDTLYNCFFQVGLHMTRSTNFVPTTVETRLDWQLSSSIERFVVYSHSCCWSIVMDYFILMSLYIMLLFDAFTVQTISSVAREGAKTRKQRDKRRSNDDRFESHWINNSASIHPNSTTKARTRANIYRK